MILYQKRYITTYVIIFIIAISVILFFRPYLFKSIKHFILNLNIEENLENRNLQVRKDPPISRVSVGPWNISTTIKKEKI
tara:strand:+ start:616 stop:855 length:240 start_codon:yes stop_codon:yes gene_type:complete